MNNGQATLELDSIFAASEMPTEMMGEESDQDVHPMALLLAEIEDSLQEPKSGDIRSGVVVDKRPNEMLIDIGFKSEGVVNSREIDRIRDTFEELVVGDEISVYVLREDKEGNLLLSISRAQAEKDWEKAEELLSNQEMFEGEVTASNRGGVIIKLGHVRGFVPASQLSSESQQGASNSEDQDAEDRWSHLMGQTLMLKVIDLDRRRNRLILSERLAVREWRRQQKEKLLSSLSEGQEFEGVISSIADFGAFVDLGGADGLIHLSELSWSRISHPSEVVSEGEKVKVQILSVDQERKRIGLSLRRLQPQPWDLVEQNYAVGDIVRGKITKLVNFGAFARLDYDGIEGLIHISELSEDRVNHPRDVVAEDQEYDLRIIRIDVDRRRMGLSLKQALPPEEQVEIDWQIAPEGADAAASSEAVENVAVH